MNAVIYVITTAVSVILLALQVLMIARAMLSWLPVDDEMPFVNFVYTVTEPVIIPFRLVLERSEFVSSIPIDIPFFVAFFAIGLIQSFLPAVI